MAVIDQHKEFEQGAWGSGVLAMSAEIHRPDYCARCGKLLEGGKGIACRCGALICHGCDGFDMLLAPHCQGCKDRWPAEFTPRWNGRGQIGMKRWSSDRTTCCS
jgi:hypothetical protein